MIHNREFYEEARETLKIWMTNGFIALKLNIVLRNKHLFFQIQGIFDV